MKHLENEELLACVREYQRARWKLESLFQFSQAKAAGLTVHQWADCFAEFCAREDEVSE